MGKELSDVQNIIYNSSLKLSKRHPNLYLLINKVGAVNFCIPKWNSIEDAIVCSVIGQMLSNKAARSIINLLSNKIGLSKNIIKWACITYNTHGPLMGVSQRKRRALYEWNKYCELNNNDWKHWNDITIDEYREKVLSIWGFGRWSADMIAIFFLGRMDIWPETDTGIKNVCRVVFQTDNMTDIKKYIVGCETTAALYFWEVINRKISII